MNKYQTNKRKLVQLINKLQTFTLQSLTRSFSKKVRGCRLISGHQTVQSFLEELREHRILRRKGNVWSLINT